MKQKGIKWFFDLSSGELRENLSELGLKGFVADQLSGWVYGKNINDPRSWHNISLKNRSIVSGKLDFSLLKVVRIDSDSAGTHKFLLELNDKKKIESVLIKEKNHFTFCISSQVGCALGCRFCATGWMGFARNLTSGEIVSQVLVMKNSLGDYSGKINLVFMGMGEPLLNYLNVKKALAVFTDERGVGISPRRITVSTAGILKNLKKLENDFPKIKISFSLNASDNAQRIRLMPVSEKEPLDSIINYFRSGKRRNRITFEYVLISGENDSLQDAEKLVRLVHGIPAKINIIPLNPNDFSDFRTPDKEKTDAFAEFLASRGLTVMVRWSKGKDIRSACGQLAGE